MQQLAAHECSEVGMARYKKAHSELVRAEYEFFDLRDVANKEGKAGPSRVIK
jgi:hypothetical protein